MPAPSTRPRLRLAAALVPLLAAAGLLFTAPATAMADETAPTWAVSPAAASGPDGRTAFDYTVAPGARIDDTVAVSNVSGFPVTYLIYAGDANNDSTSGAYSLVASPTDDTDVGAWVGLDQTPGATACTTPAAVGGDACTHVPAGAVALTLGAHSEALVPFTITVPTNARPGDHAGGIVAVYRSQKTVHGQTQPVTVEQRVGSRIHLRVEGALTAQLRISAICTGVGPTADPFAGSAVTSYALTNAGNVRLDATVGVSVDGPFGIHLFTVPGHVLSDLLPGQTVTVRTRPVTVFPGVLTFTTLHAAATVPGGGAHVAPVAQTALGWAVSWGAVLVVLLVAAAIVAVALWRRRYRRRLAATVSLAAQAARDEAIAAVPPTLIALEQGEYR